MTQKLAIWPLGADHEENLKDNYFCCLFLDKVFGWNGSETFEIGAFFYLKTYELCAWPFNFRKKGWWEIFMWIVWVVKQLENNENNPV